jgi:hypothetical protein
MKRIPEVLFLGFVAIFLIFIYRQVIFGDKVAFPTNFLAHFYAPYAAEKFPGWEHGIPNKPIGADQIRFFYPSKSLGYHTWNPYIFAGSPNLANFQSAMFYPFNWLYKFFPQDEVWNLLVIIQPLLAVIFTYLFLRSINLSKVASFLGAFCFGFSGYMITWSQENAVVGQASLWLPLILYGIEKHFSIAVVAWVMSFLAGYFQSTFYITIFSGAYFLYRRKPVTSDKLLMTILGAFTVLPQFIPSLQAFFLSPRPSVNITEIFQKYLLPVTYFINALVPDLYGNPGSYNMARDWSYNETSLYIGTAAIIVAIFGFTKNRFFTAAGIITFLLTINSPITQFLYSLPIPLISTFQPTRIFLITTFCLAVLTAVGLDKINLKSVRKICLVALFVLAVACLYFTFQPPYPAKFVTLKNLVLPAILIIATLGLSFFGQKIFPLAIFGLTVFSQFYFFNKYLVIGEKQFFYPPHPIFEFMQGKLDRYLAIDHNIFPNIPAQFKTYTPEGFDPIFPARYGQLVFAARNGGKLTDQIPRIETTLSELDRTKYEVMASNPARLKLISLLGIKYLFSDKPENIFNSSQFKLIGNFGNWTGFENLFALPRVFLADNFIVETDKQKIFNLIFDPTLDLAKTVILEETVPDFAANSLPGSAQIISYEPERVVINTQSDGQKILFLSDNFYPGWRATTNGQPTKIYRSNYTFRAFPVPSGNHEIIFEYKLDYPGMLKSIRDLKN